MAIYKRGRIWWYKFTWSGEPIRESTKQTNKRTAEQMQAAHKTALAKGLVGIRERAPVVTLKDFLDRDFLPFVESRFLNKPNTLDYYNNGLKSLAAHAPLAGCTLGTITADRVGTFVAKLRQDGLAVSSINRQLEVLRRALKLAVEWGKVERTLPKVEMLRGENHRERVLSDQEERCYVAAATEIGYRIEDAYRRALKGIRAAMRNEQPIAPEDPFVLRDATALLIDCGLRPDECFRLRWEYVRDSALHVPFGKTENARRTIPLTQRCAAFLDAALAGDFGLGISSTHQERAYRKVQLEEATCEGLQSGENIRVRALHIPPHMPDAVVRVHGPLHFGISCRT